MGRKFYVGFISDKESFWERQKMGYHTEWERRHDTHCVMWKSTISAEQQNIKIQKYSRKGESYLNIRFPVKTEWKSIRKELWKRSYVFYLILYSKVIVFDVILSWNIHKQVGTQY